MNKVFKYNTTVTIGDTNLLQNMYFVNHFKVQGAARELWVKECVPNAVKHLSGGLILVTKSAHCDYKRDFYLFDDVLCQMNIGRLRRASFELVFTFTNGKSKEPYALGHQEIVFSDQNHKICKMPTDFYFAAKEYQVE